MFGNQPNDPTQYSPIIAPITREDPPARDKFRLRIIWLTSWSLVTAMALSSLAEKWEENLVTVFRFLINKTQYEV